MQVLSFRHTKQTSKNVVDTTFKHWTNHIIFDDITDYFGDLWEKSELKMTLQEKSSHQQKSFEYILFRS